MKRDSYQTLFRRFLNNSIYKNLRENRQDFLLDNSIVHASLRRGTGVLQSQCFLEKHWWVFYCSLWNELPGKQGMPTARLCHSATANLIESENTMLQTNKQVQDNQTQLQLFSLPHSSAYLQGCFGTGTKFIKRKTKCKTKWFRINRTTREWRSFVFEQEPTFSGGCNEES